MKTVYLAGSINGLIFKEATQWRETLGTSLTKYGYNVLSPTRYLNSLEYLSTEILNDANLTTNPLYILRRDRWDIKHSDIIIAKVDTLGHLPMIGTLLELGMALELGKRVILVGLPPKFYHHPFFLNFEKCSNLDSIFSHLHLKHVL